LVAALLTPRPPELLVLNEPETSLHGSLLEPLGRLVMDAARHSQVVVTSHSATLTDALAEASGEPPIRLRRHNGATVVDRDE
jgi:predicted ATPase